MAKTINDVYLQLFHRLRDGGDPQPSMTARELTALACRADKNHTAGWAHAYLDDATVNYAGLLSAASRSRIFWASGISTD